MTTIARGTDDVFRADRYTDAERRQVKPRLARAVNDLLKSRKLKQREIAPLLSIQRPKVSALKNYRLDQCSVEKLMGFLTVINQDVEIMVRPNVAAHEAGHISALAVQ